MNHHHDHQDGPDPREPGHGRDARDNGDPLGRSDYQLNAEFGYQRAAELFARAAAEPDPLHQRRLLRDADVNLGWAQINDQLEQARAVLDALDPTHQATGDHVADNTDHASTDGDDGDGGQADGGEFGDHDGGEPVPDPLEQARQAVDAIDLTDTSPTGPTDTEPADTDGKSDGDAGDDGAGDSASDGDGAPP